MKIVQTFWSGTENAKKDPLKITGGWKSKKYLLISWALSCLQLKKYYGSACLVTDQYGKKLLIDKLQLPYDKVLVALDDFSKKYSTDLWVFAKMYSYKMQNEPFLHVDGDVFIWEKFSSDLLQNPLIAQNKEKNFEVYNSAINSMEKHFNYIPREIEYERKQSDNIYMVNAGILGGTNVKLLNEYANKAFYFLEKNKDKIRNINSYYLGFIFEQYLFYCFAQYHGIKIATLLPETILDSSYKEVTRIENVPPQKYVHALGSFKKNTWKCELLARIFRVYYENYYDKIVNLINEEQNNEHPVLVNGFDITNDVDNFYRTKKVIKYYHKNSTFRLFDKLKIIKDVFIYECNICFFKLKIKNKLYYVNKQKEYDINIHKLFSNDLHYILKQDFSIDKDICIVESGWKWFNFQEEDLNDLLIKEKSYFNTILCVDAYNFKIDELGIDDFNIILIELVKNNNSLYDVMSMMKRIYDIDNSNEKIEEFNNLLIYRLRELMLNMIVKWQPANTSA